VKEPHQLSDARLKEDIKEVSGEDALEIVSKLRAMTFYWKPNALEIAAKLNENKNNISDNNVNINNNNVNISNNNNNNDKHVRHSKNSHDVDGKSKGTGHDIPEITISHAESSTTSPSKNGNLQTEASKNSDSNNGNASPRSKSPTLSPRHERSPSPRAAGGNLGSVYHGQSDDEYFYFDDDDDDDSSDDEDDEFSSDDEEPKNEQVFLPHIYL
jgi:hypothetical protein